MKYIWVLVLVAIPMTESNALSVSGVIRDAETQEPIPFVNIWVAGSTEGTISDLDGAFVFECDSSCTIMFSSIGYLPYSRRMDVSTVDEVWDISLESDIVSLPEISVKPDFSYDEEMFRKVLTHKDSNNKGLVSIREYGNYDRTTILLASDSTKRLHRILADSEEAFIYDKKSDVSYVPVYMNEALSNIHFKNEKKEVDLVSNKRDGIFPNMNDQIENMVLEKIAIEFNFYKNQINVLDRGFKSPLSNNATQFYNIYLSDSLNDAGTKFYKFSFYPRNEHSTVFKGHFWVEDETFALTSISAAIAKKANVNFISGLNVKVFYEKQPNGKWFYKSQKLQVNFSPGKSTVIKMDDEQSRPALNNGDFFINRTLKYIVAEDSSEAVVPSILKDPRLAEYDEIELEAREGIDILKENRVVKSVDKTGNMFLTGYYSTKKFDIGPIFDLYSSNQLEGHRITVPIRTGEGMSRNFTIGGYLGYGSKSKLLKYGASMGIMLPQGRRSILTLSYCDDYFITQKTKYTQFIQENPYSKGDGNFVSAITSGQLNPYVFQMKKLDIGYQTDLSDNIGLLVKPYYHQNFSSEYVQFKKDDVSYAQFNNYGMLINLRFSFDQAYDDLYFSRIFYGNVYPVINLSFDIGETEFEGQNEGSYYALSNLSVKHRFNMGPAYVRYMINLGYQHGSVPYTMMEKPFGRNSLGYSRYSYNLLNYASFAHNLYSNVHINLNGGGVIFSRIPLVSRLNLREMVSFKTYYGIQTSTLKSPIDIPSEYSNTMSKPYMELGLGITNIFKVFRIEYVHLIDKNGVFSDHASRHGVRMRFEACF